MSHASRTSAAGSRETRRQLVDRLLSDRAYHIEFNGFLTNHVKHAVIALDGLGAPSERVEGYFRKYAAETPYGFGLEPARASGFPVDRERWLLYRGRRTNFEGLRRFFAEEERRLGLALLLERYVPDLLPGLAGGLLHGLIHLGWALDAGQRDMVVEGLAYLAYTYVASRARDAESSAANVYESLAEAPSREEIRRWLHETRALDALQPSAGFQSQLAGTGTQLVVAQVLERGHPFVDARPAWIDRLPFDSLWQQLHEAAARVYLGEPADFVLLHVVTGLHALEQIARAMPEDRRREVVAAGWRAIAAVLIARGGLAVAPRDVAGPGPSWDGVLSRAMREDEEHNIKLVYVMRSHWRRYGQSLFLTAASRFIATPSVPRFSPDGPGFRS